MMSCNELRAVPFIYHLCIAEVCIHNSVDCLISVDCGDCLASSRQRFVHFFPLLSNRLAKLQQHK